MKAKNLVPYIGLVLATCIAATFIALYAVEVSNDPVSPVNIGRRCGGVQEGNYGELEHVFSIEDGTSNCLWIIRLAHGSGIRLTVDQLNTTLMVYSEQRGRDGSLLPTVLGKPNVGSPVELQGKYAVMILSAIVSCNVRFRWESIDGADDGPKTTVGYISSNEGIAEWRPYELMENLVWAVNIVKGRLVSWQMTVEDGACEPDFLCFCSYFGIYKVTAQGSLAELGKACGSGATEEFTNGDTQLLVFSYVNITKQVEVNVRLSWRISSGPPLTSPTSTSSTIVTTALTGQPTDATPSTSSPSPSSSDGTTENSQMTSSTSPGAVMTTTAGPTLPPADPKMLLAPASGGLQIYSLETSEAIRMGNTSIAVLGVAYDAKADKVFWFDYEPELQQRPYRVYSADLSGNEVQLLLKSNYIFNAVDYDWITGTLYLVRSGGITVCNATDSCDNFPVSNMTDPRGLAVDPNNGVMYWTSRKDRNIMRAGMDGSDPEVILSNLTSPMGITIDFQSSRLYWTSWAGDAIETSDLNGMDHRVVISLAKGSRPYGIGMFNGALYWSNQELKTVQTCFNVEDCQAREVYNANAYLRDLAVMHESNQPRTTRHNVCAGMGCSHH